MSVHNLASPAAVRVLGFGLCLVALIGLTIAHAQDDDDLLKEMSEAVRTLNYRGVMVYARPGEMRSLRIVHRNTEGREQERIQSLGAEPREILRDEDVVTCILPKDRQVMLDRRDIRGVLGTVRQFSTEELAPHYLIVREENSRLIDRACEVYYLKPQDEFRYGYRIWVDESTSLPLKLDLVSQSGKVLEQAMFTQVEFPEHIADSEMKPALNPADYQWIRHDETDSMPMLGESHWRIRKPPPGFRLVDRGMRMPADSDIPIEHLLYSDGLATVSVMLRPMRNKRVRFLGMSRMGAMHVYARQINGQHVTVMGEVPEATVEYFARQLEAVEPASDEAHHPALPEAAGAAVIQPTRQ